MQAKHLHATIVQWGPVALALGFFGIAVHAVIAPTQAADVYGIPVEQDGLAWVRATGLRDGVLGIITLSVRQHPRLLSSFLAAVVLLPIADIAIVLSYTGQFVTTLPHVLGATGVGLLWLLTVKNPRPAEPTSS